MSMADETTQVCHNLHNTVAELNDYISELSWHRLESLTKMPFLIMMG
jgi:hypothetical protein